MPTTISLQMISLSSVLTSVLTSLLRLLSCPSMSLSDIPTTWETSALLQTAPGSDPPRLDF